MLSVPQGTRFAIDHTALEGSIPPSKSCTESLDPNIVSANHAFSLEHGWI
jgi:hypothetical protein